MVSKHLLVPVLEVVFIFFYFLYKIHKYTIYKHTYTNNHMNKRKEN